MSVRFHCSSAFISSTFHVKVYSFTCVQFHCTLTVVDDTDRIVSAKLSVAAKDSKACMYVIAVTFIIALTGY